jgi:hypothetical protein
MMRKLMHCRKISTIHKTQELIDMSRNLGPMIGRSALDGECKGRTLSEGACEHPGDFQLK